MNKTVLSVVVVGTFTAGFVAAGLNHPRDAVGAASVHGGKVLYYVDPMHPQFKASTPGVAPDCGMRLEPVYDDAPRRLDADADPSTTGARVRTITVDRDEQQLIGVRVGAAQRATATERLRVYGRVAADETRSYTVDVGIDGYIRELASVTTGSQVHQDQWLATLSSPDVRLPIQGYLVALEILDRSERAGESPTQLDLANASLQQSIDRLLTLGVSRPQMADIRRTRIPPPNVRITAPADGFVVSRTVSVGQKVGRGDELYRIVDLRNVWIRADVFGADVSQVRPGTTAAISIPGHAGSFAARVSRDVLPQFDPVTRSLSVRLDAENPAYLLRPDMPVDVFLELASPPSIVIPSDAVFDSGLERTVFVERRPGVFEARSVKTGWRSGDRVQITEGLAEGERLAVSGAFLLGSESHRQDPSTAHLTR